MENTERLKRWQKARKDQDCWRMGGECCVQGHVKDKGVSTVSVDLYATNRRYGTPGSFSGVLRLLVYHVSGHGPEEVLRKSIAAAQKLLQQLKENKDGKDE